MSWLEWTKKLLYTGGDALEERYSNPEAVLDRYISELTSNLETAKAAITALRLQIDQLKSRAKELRADEKMWERRAKKAVIELKDDEVAKEALRRKTSVIAEYTELESIVTSLNNDVALMEKNLAPLEAKIIEATGRKERLAARKASEKARGEVREQLGRSGVGGYKEIEEQLIELDAESETLSRMKLLSVRDIQLPASQADSEIEKELDRIKKENRR